MNMKAKASLPLGMVGFSADQLLVVKADRRDANIARTKSLKLAKLMLMMDKALFFTPLLEVNFIVVLQSRVIFRCSMIKCVPSLQAILLAER